MVSAKIMKECVITVMIQTGKCKAAAHNICNLRYKTPYETPVVFRNGSNYNYHFITKQLAEKFEESFKCLEENTKKYITLVPIDKQQNEKIIKHKKRFIEHLIFMTSSLSSLNNCTSSLEYVTAKCVDCNTTYEKKLSESFENTDSSAMETSTKSVSCCVKVFILTNTWISEKDSTKPYYQQRRNSDIFLNADMLLMVGKNIRGGICHAIHRYVKANKKNT